MNKQHFTRYIKNSDFIALFNELGWDHFDHALPVAVNDGIFQLEGIVEKKGFVILHCRPASDGKIPVSAIRRQIEHRVTQAYFEHLIIYTNQAQTHQIWQLALKEEGRPKIIRDISYHTHQAPENLFQRLRGLLFTLDEEDAITLVDVKARVTENFARNTEKVTKKFYAEFKKQHGAFLGFIEGIDDHLPNKENRAKQWYASLMLNRLMFCYFIQKKGFLDRNPDYLQAKLRESKAQAGGDQFYSFYRGFLRRLFHEGLGRPEAQRAGGVAFGRIPYLNGGLFDIHELERQFAAIDIKDEAFERIFTFFDTWNWHLDTRAEATGKDINPDVIGYIFEKYINDRAAMGAYYTKDDITEYIGKHCILPFLCDDVKRRYPAPFAADGEIWRTLRASGDTYIYDAVKHGVESPLPDHIAVGLTADGVRLESTLSLPRRQAGLFRSAENLTPGPSPKERGTTPSPVGRGGEGFRALATRRECNSPARTRESQNSEMPASAGMTGGECSLLERRAAWNTPTPPEYGLPTEIWRETIARRQRYAEVKKRIQQGDITAINDFITYNLNIRQFLQDLIEETDDAALIRHLYKAIVSVTVLDPTCGGSGAFLFAALNILEPLYEGCLQRMELFAAEEPGKHKFFEEVLQESRAAHHPNLQYFIYKSIILNNLYGVDLMREAVEIAKLRLFLKLVATVDPNPRKPNYGLEPLPDIDFNIRAGNTLVGFATEQELLDAISQREGLFAADKLAQFKEQCQVVSQAFSRFKDAQLVEDAGSESFKATKQELIKRLDTLNNELSRYLASNYGISEANIPDAKKREENYQKWLDTHQPFHWFAEFYDILVTNGGFSIIIGNPPYLNLSFLKNYKLKGFSTLKTRNLYSLILEKCQSLPSAQGRQGYIIPVSSIATEGYLTLQKILSQHKMFVSSYDDRPAHLFSDLDKNTLSILLLYGRTNTLSTYSSRLCRWNADERDHIFEALQYEKTPITDLKGCIPKIGHKLEKSIWTKIFEHGKQLALYYDKGSGKKAYYSRKVNAFLQILDFVPEVKDGTGNLRPPSEFKELHFSSIDEALAVVSCFNSTLFRWFIDATTDGSHVNRREVDNFPFNPERAVENFPGLINLAKKLSNKLKETSEIRTMRYKHDSLTVQCIIPKYAKNIIDDIDRILAEYYEFTEEELDFLINYDIKYRMGKELNNGD